MKNFGLTSRSEAHTFPCMKKPSAPVVTPRPKLESRLRKIGSLEDAAYYLRGKNVKVSSSFLSMLSSGVRDPSLSMAKKLAEALEIKLSDIVGE